MAQNLSKEVSKVTMLQAKLEVKTCDVTYINFVVCSLGLASQEVDVFVKSTNEMPWNLYGYDEITQPHLFIQAKIYLGKNVIGIRVSVKLDPYHITMLQISNLLTINIFAASPILLLQEVWRQP